MTDACFNLIFKGKVESGHDHDEARCTLESLFEFDTENQVDLFNGQTIILGKNMNAMTANSFKQALAEAGITTHLIAANDAIVEEDIQSQRLAQRRNNIDRRGRVRSAAILPDRRLTLERRG